MKLDIKIKKVQHLDEVEFSVDLDNIGLTCITGKNGAGKTTLIKCIRNITNADTFQKTSSEDIFSSDSSIEYTFDGKTILFSYDSVLKSLNSKDPIPRSLRSRIAVELPIPHGERFNFFQKISNADPDIRRAVLLKKYSRPEELLNFLRDIYPQSDFERLVEISVKKAKYYCILQEGVRYLREDYFSSGEYFLLSLYRRIVKGQRLIVIDEIDISLDAAAQVRLMRKLREFGKKYEIGFVFTTHSLAMMRTLKEHELFHMERDLTSRKTSISQVSYSYIKSVLYGFAGWDRYILTEDDVLRDFIAHVIRVYCGPLFFEYKIIYIGGGSNTTALMQRNATEEFFAAKDCVICVLDGDQAKLRHAKRAGVLFIPMESVEKYLLAECLSGFLSTKFLLSNIIDDDLDRLRRYLSGTSSETPSILKNDRSQIRPRYFFERFSEAIQLVFMNKKAATKKSPTPMSISSTEKEFNSASKKLFTSLISNKILSRQEIFELLCGRNKVAVEKFADELRLFLTASVK